MKFFGSFILVLLFQCSQILHAQNAPVTSVPDTSFCPGSLVTIPVRVTSFNNIGSISLKLQYSTSSLVYVSSSNVSGIPGLTINGNLAGTVVVGEFNFLPGGVSLPDHAILLSLTFSYSGGSCGLNWFDNGGSCEYAGPTPNFNVLNDIPTSQYYQNGSVGPLLTADFSAGTQLPGVNDTVVFTDLSAGLPTGWSWGIAPDSYTFVNGTNSASQNPNIKFLSNGAYTVSLVITKGDCSSKLIRENWIHAGIPGLWTGQVSSDWNNASNWHNWLIPDSATQVTIPVSAASWPVFQGDFSIGVQCLNLTISGPTGQLTVNGNFFIP